MKLLLTSEGITNESIKKKFLEMVSKKPEEMTIAYIPTAALISPKPHKKWMINNLKRLDAMGIENIDIVDFSAIPRDNWLPRLERADVIFVEGGNPMYLKKQMDKVAFDKLLQADLKEKVYVGCSAGSNVMGEILIKSSKEGRGFNSDRGFSIVPLSVRPHFLRFDRLQFTEEVIAGFAKEFNSTFYAIDDNSAIAVEDGNIEMVSEGNWKKFDK